MGWVLTQGLFWKDFLFKQICKRYVGTKYIKGVRVRMNVEGWWINTINNNEYLVGTH